jgi:hypothetical protein
MYIVGIRSDFPKTVGPSVLKGSLSQHLFKIGSVVSVQMSKVDISIFSKGHRWPYLKFGSQTKDPFRQDWLKLAQWF